MTLLEELYEQYGKQNVRLKHFNGPITRMNGKKGNGTTIAIIKDGDFINVGFSECSVKDTFSRKKGRLIALGRVAKQALRDVDNCYSFVFNINDTDVQLPIEVPKFLYQPRLVAGDQDETI
jgi:hypothetical protein